MFSKKKETPVEETAKKQDMEALAELFVKKTGFFARASQYIAVSPKCICSSEKELSRHIFRKDIPMILTGSEFIPYHYVSENFSGLTQEDMKELAERINAKLENRFEISAMEDPNIPGRVQAYSMKNTEVVPNPYKMWK